MSDDQLVAARGTSRPKPGQHVGGAAGNRGTGEITYHFSLDATPDLRALHGENRIEFHASVLRMIFGPSVETTPFMRDKRYRDTKWATKPEQIDGPTFGYYLSNSLIHQIGRVPVIVPVSIEDAAGNDIGDVEGLSGQIALAVRTRDIPKDIVTILLDGIGFDPDDLRIWDRMSLYERLTTLDDVTAIAKLMSELDDVALIEVMRTTKPARRHTSKHLPRVSPDKVRAFRQKLEALGNDVAARERRAQLASFDEALGSATLHGCETLYFKLQELDRTPHEYTGGMAEISGTSTIREIPSPRRIALQSEIDGILREKGFKPDTLGKLIKAFEKSFEQRAAVFARQKLARHLRFFDYHSDRTNSAKMVAAIQAQGANLIGSVFNAASLRSLDGITAALAQNQKQHAELIKQFPLMQYANFWTLLDASQKGLKGDFSIAHFNVLVEETRRSILEMLSELKTDSYVWKGDVMINGALTAFGIAPSPKSPHSHNAMLSDIIQLRMKEEQKKGLLKSVLMGLAAIALSLTGIGALVAIGVAISLYDVYTMIEDRTQLRHYNLSGFGSRSPPSDFWILLAIVGVAGDIGGLVKVMSAGKLAKASQSGAALEELLTEAGIRSERARQSARKLRAVKVDVENAKRKLLGAAGAMHSIGGGTNEAILVSYHLARLGLRKFEHFLLELPRSRLPSRVPDTSDPDVIRRALTPEELKHYKGLHRTGVLQARNDVAQLDEVIAATEAVGQDLNLARQKATQISRKRFAPGVKRKLSDTKSPYNTLRAEHHAAMRAKERLDLKLKALKARLKLLTPAGEHTPQSWGFLAEDWARLTPRKGSQIWPEMHSSSVEAVDSIRKGAGGGPEVMQAKAIVSELASSIEGSARDKIREAHSIFNSNKYKDLARNFNENRFAKAADYHGFQLPRTWQDPKLKIHLEIPIVTNATVDVRAVRAAVIDLFYEKFPSNAVMRIRTVTPEEVVSVLEAAAEAVN